MTNRQQKPRTKYAEQSERTRAAILDAAESEFADRGYAGARVDAIAHAVGIRRASLFYHYPDKAAIYTALLDDRVLPYLEEIQKLLDLGRGAVEGEAAVALLMQGVSLQAEFVARKPLLGKIFLREIVDFDRERPSPLTGLLQPLAKDIRTFLHDRREERICDPVDPDHLITAVLGASVLHAAVQPLLNPRKTTQTLTRTQLERHKSALRPLVGRLLGLHETSGGSP